MNRDGYDLAELQSICARGAVCTQVLNGASF